jgi:hypothetical protein
MTEPNGGDESQALLQVAGQQPQALTQPMTQLTQVALQWSWWVAD